MLESPFAFTICQEGAENALKAELAVLRPDWRPSYSRPGFVTWKSAGKTVRADERLDSVFARAYALSIGKGTDAASAWEVVRARLAEAGKGPLRLHASPGDPALREEVLALAPPGTFHASEPAEAPGEGVFTLHQPKPGEIWVGFHLHSDAHSPDPGGDPRIAVPETAPSRAYGKIAEAARYPGIPLRAGDRVIEIGSSPGGMSAYLLERGCRVVGIDPAEMDPGVLSNPRFTHLRKPVAAARIEDIGPGAQWIVIDLKLVPNVALDQFERFERLTKETLLGGMLTLKFNDSGWRERVPELMERVRKMGMARVRGIQLPANRHEFTVVALTAKGAARSR